jgi:hypothetical protein
MSIMSKAWAAKKSDSLKMPEAASIHDTPPVSATGNNLKELAEANQRRPSDGPDN